MTPYLDTGSRAERIDEDTREGEIARRSVLFGLWAGRHAGLEGDALETYALSIHLADHRIPGHDDVIAKVAADLACCGKPDERPEIAHLFSGDGAASQSVALSVAIEDGRFQTVGRGDNAQRRQRIEN